MPNNWKTYKLGELVDIKGGKRLPKGDTLVLTKTKHPYIRVTDMGTRTIPIEKVQYVPNDVFPKISRYIVNTNDLILSIVGTVGSISIIDEKLDNASLTENCVKITNLKNVDKEFLYYYLMSDVGQFEISKGIVGSTQPKLPIYNINTLEIVLPENLQEQQSIASILSAIDDKIENNLAINKTLEEMAMALYKHWFVDFGPFQDGEFVESELGMIPIGWEVLRLQDVSTLTAGGDKPKKCSNQITEECSIPIYSNGITNDGLYGYTDTARINEESITVSARGTIGFVCLRLEPYLPIVRLIAVVPKKEIVSSKYLFYWLKSQNINGNGTTQQQLTVPDFKVTNVLVPQIELINAFTEIVNPYYEKINSNKIENQTLTQLRDTLLPQLISGAVRLKEFRE